YPVRGPFLVSTYIAPPTLTKIATQSIIYNTWRQRNLSVHLTVFTLTEVTFKTIDRDIPNIITAKRHMIKYKTLMPFWIR
ncbi:hypothetical protein F2Q68_00010674, partial [Brassica cretica]